MEKRKYKFLANLIEILHIIITIISITAQLEKNRPKQNSLNPLISLTTPPLSL